MSREELVGRFQTEARAAGLLTHPNIVVIYDAGEEEGLFYITMEMVEGRSLQTLLDARQLFPLPRVMKMMEQVCSALDFAHHHGVVHRDIKPANLMLTAEDIMKITDFGTAKTFSTRHGANRACDGDAVPYVPRASEGQAGRRPLRYFFAGRDPLRINDRRETVPGAEHHHSYL